MRQQSPQGTVSCAVLDSHSGCGSPYESMWASEDQEESVSWDRSSPEKLKQSAKRSHDLGKETRFLHGPVFGWVLMRSTPVCLHPLSVTNGQAHAEKHP